MEVIFARHQKLYEEYYRIPMEKRNQRSDKLIEDLKEFMEETIAKARLFRERFATLKSQSDGALYSILDAIEALLGGTDFSEVGRKVDLAYSMAEAEKSEDDDASTSMEREEPESISDQDDTNVTGQSNPGQNDEVAGARTMFAGIIDHCEEQREFEAADHTTKMQRDEL